PDIRPRDGQPVAAQVDGLGEHRGRVVDQPGEDELGLLLVGVVAQHVPGGIGSDRVDAAGDAGLHGAPHVRVDLVEDAGAVLGYHGRQQHHVLDQAGQGGHEPGHGDTAERVPEQDDVGQAALDDVGGGRLRAVVQGDGADVDVGADIGPGQVDVQLGAVEERSWQNAKVRVEDVVFPGGKRLIVLIAW